MNHILIDFKVTSDMCVKHFLLQPDHEFPMGIKLQGWNEKPFGELKCGVVHFNVL